VNFVDIFMSIFFVLFLVFIFKGYHQNKLEEREKKEDFKKKNS